MKNICRWLLAVLSILSFSMLLPAQEEQPAPRVSKNYTLQYVINEYTQEIENTLVYLVDSVLRPEDQIILITPAKIYSYPGDKWRSLTASQLKEDLITRLRTDTEIVGSGFQNIYSDMEALVLELKPPPMKEEAEIMALVSRYRSLTKNLAAIMTFNVPIYLKIAAVLKNQTNQNHMIIFLGQMFVPVADEETMEMYSNSKSRRTMLELFRFSFHEDIDVKSLEDAFQEAKIRMDLIYCNKKAHSRLGIDLKEVSLDLYNAYKKITEATGGETNATFNPAHLLQEIITPLNRSEKD